METVNIKIEDFRFHTIYLDGGRKIEQPVVIVIQRCLVSISPIVFSWMLLPGSRSYVKREQKTTRHSKHRCKNLDLLAALELIVAKNQIDPREN
ncbi:hypothetical protein CEXT_708381 [Caerostris extrusa]|uniref:Uncharacterized protein n=1 Tax=Caerostris extrusa TaxID=172846 RepID=A0AAV4SYT5_CAEEX|nr:hypothetical protein CEXT_708381 [Caerostris extrusa]